MAENNNNQTNGNKAKRGEPTVNNVTLMGRLGADPDFRHTQGGTAVANFRIATNEVWGDANGDQRKRTEWHKIVAWGKLAEICREYLKKGRQVYVEGRLQTNQWEDKDGNKHYTTEIVAREVKFLAPPRGDSKPADGPTDEGAA